MEKTFLLTIGEDYLSKLDEISEKLESKGMHIQNKFDYGIITGSLDEDKVNAIAAITGIESIEEDQAIQISPPDEEIQ